MEKEWVLPRKLSDEEHQFVAGLVANLKCPPQIAELLFRKGINSEEEIKHFFQPSMSKLQDPYLFAEMGKAVERIQKAIDSHERITIYGDYDVDGTTATALLYLGLKRIGAEIDFYIPHRMIDG